jgi:hypothetical protein
VSLVFIDTNKKVINTIEYDPVVVRFSEVGSVLLNEGGAECSLTFSELGLIYRKAKEKLGLFDD